MVDDRSPEHAVDELPVVIVGAGAAGIAVARRLLQAALRIVILEAGSYVGGLWEIDNDNDLSVAYESLHINSEPRTTAYPGFPFPPGTPLFPDHRTVLRYLNDFTDAYDIRRHIRFNSKAVGVERDANGQWTVRLDSGDSYEARHVVIASGHLGVAAHPEEFRANYEGEYLHVSEYRRPQPFTGKRVLVVGLGNSGLDAASDLVSFAASVDNAVRSPVLVMPRMVLGMPTARLLGYINRPWLPEIVKRQVQRTISRIFHGRMEQWGLRTPTTKTHPASSLTYMPAVAYGYIKVRPGIESVSGRRVTFVDGTSGEYDAVIAATGYYIHLPFLGEFAPVEDRRLDAYKRILHPDWEGLYFVGFFNANGGPNISLMDVQAEYVTALVTGVLKRPTRAAMLDDIEIERDHLRENYPSAERYGLELESGRYIKQMRTLLAPVAVPPPAPSQLRLAGDAR
jgi:dimethylaniline monooxygenase (N-oxide forming)